MQDCGYTLLSMPYEVLKYACGFLCMLQHFTSSLKMGKPKLWSFVLEGDFLLLKTENDIQHCFGPIIDVRCFKDKPSHIKVCENYH